ncbi:MAG: MlaD family protein [Cyanobacteriota bacterium]|nr:MlaD family protein [Cyanobacteriota bacterium]
MRSRTAREGSVGLFMLAGLVVSAGVALWLREVRFGQQTYNLRVEFANANGLSVGTPVRYRGVDVGQIVALEPGTNGVEARIEIDSTDLLIPKNATVKANQSGLLNQSAIDITPQRPLPETALDLSPIANNCQESPIFCDEDFLKGQAGATLDDLLTSSVRLSQVYASPEFANSLNKLLATVEVTASDVSKLSAELKLLSRSVRGQIPAVSGNVAQTTNTLSATAVSLDRTATRLSRSVDATADEISESIDTTANNLDQLSLSLSRLIRANESSLGNTLASVTSTSTSLQELLVGLRPAVRGLNTALEPGEVERLIQNLDTLINNATRASGDIQVLVENTTAASENLRNLSGSFSDPTLLLSLQQTLNSARETFENARKITADIDELTGDPEFRRNLRNLVDGLGNLVSSTEELEQQIQVGRTLEQSRQAVRELRTEVEVAQKSRDPKTQSQKQATPVEESQPAREKKEPKRLERAVPAKEPTSQ